jgi:hypothetical protein
MLEEGQALIASSLTALGGTGLEPVTSCVSKMNSDSKCLSFILLHAFVKRQYGFHTGDILATYCNPTGNTDKTDARMTPEALDINVD